MSAPLLFALFGNEAVPLRATSAGLLITADLPVASDGVVLPIASLAKTVTYSAAGTEAYIDVAHGGVTYRKTISYTAGRFSGETGWVAQ